MVPVPKPDDSWDSIARFALSYNGYDRFDSSLTDERASFSALADFANAAESRWQRDGTLPETLHEMRCALFFEQRRSGQGFDFGFVPSDEWEDPDSGYLDWISYVKALVQGIREVVGDEILMPSDYKE